MIGVVVVFRTAGRVHPGRGSGRLQPGVPGDPPHGGGSEQHRPDSAALR